VEAALLLDMVVAVVASVCAVDKVVADANGGSAFFIIVKCKS